MQTLGPIYKTVSGFIDKEQKKGFGGNKRRPFDSLNKYTNVYKNSLATMHFGYLQTLIKIYFNTNTLMLFKFVLNYQPMLGDCGIV